MMRHRTKNKKQGTIFARSEKGFTILELMFVIAIFGIMTSITLFGFRDYGVQTSFDNLAQDVALHLVSAQKAAISGKLSLSTLSPFPPRVGVTFTSGTTPTPATQEFTYFNDIPTVTTYNGKYDTTPSCGATGSECISKTRMTNGEYVALISYAPFGSPYTSLPAGSTASVTFTRPFPDAMITLCLSSGTCYPPVQNVYIELGSTTRPTMKKTIVVTGLGEVRVYSGSTACAYSGGGGC
ncbi:MAG: type II secretion system protein [Candidatus Pacebacteria bacterium]|nr:type II secretion system protein [Candidatus Paceibacterota bacterium]